MLVFELNRWNETDLAVETAVVEPVDVLGDGDLEVVDAFPRAPVADQFCLEQRVEACGTPVVALRRGSVPEVVVDGVTGILCDDPEELPAAIFAARRLSPADSRQHVRRRFDADTMVAGYEALYRRALLGRTPTHLNEAGVPGTRRGVPAGAAA